MWGEVMIDVLGMLFTLIVVFVLIILFDKDEEF